MERGRSAGSCRLLPGRIPEAHPRRALQADLRARPDAVARLDPTNPASLILTRSISHPGLTLAMAILGFSTRPGDRRADGERRFRSRRRIFDQRSLRDGNGVLLLLDLRTRDYHAPNEFFRLSRWRDGLRAWVTISGAARRVRSRGLRGSLPMSRSAYGDRSDWISLVAVVTLVQAASLMTRTLTLLSLPLLTQAAGARAAGSGVSPRRRASAAYLFPVGTGDSRQPAAFRQLQIGCVMALALGLTIADHWAAMLLAAFVIWHRHGPSTPAGSRLLMRNVPAERRATIFSDQTGQRSHALDWWRSRCHRRSPCGPATGPALSPPPLVLAMAVGLGLWQRDRHAGRRHGVRDRRRWRSLPRRPVEMFRLVFASRAAAGDRGRPGSASRKGCCSATTRSI